MNSKRKTPGTYPTHEIHEIIIQSLYKKQEGTHGKEMGRTSKGV